jgi:hypothetical protein
MYFTRQKQAVFRNMSAHYSKMKVDDEKFVELSKFAEWWIDYDFEKNNWFNDENILNAKQTFDLIENDFDLKILFDYERIASSYNRLYLLDFDESVYL